MVNIQLFGGPGTGKSLISSLLFVELKINSDFKVEEIHEYAKDLTYAKDYLKLGDQLHILSEQNHRMRRLENEVDIAIHDSPFLMGLTYLNEKENFPKKEFISFVVELYKSYNNINIFIERNLEYDYEEYGRNQSLKEAQEKDKEIKNILDKFGIKYITIKNDDNTIKNIINEINKNN